MTLKGTGGGSEVAGVNGGCEGRVTLSSTSVVVNGRT